MKAGDIELYKTYLCTIDPVLPSPKYNEVKLDPEDALYGYTAKLCAAALSDTAARTASYGGDDYLAEVAPKEPEGLEAMVSTLSEVLYALVRDNATIRPGCAIFTFFLAQERPHVAMFKLPYTEMFQCRLSPEGEVSWILNSKVMPKASLRGCEYFTADVVNGVARVADVEAYIDECKVNYLAETVLQLRAKASEKKTVEVMSEAAVEVIRECYPKEQVPEKIMEYKTEVANHAEATGCVSVPVVEQTVFSDSETAGERFLERMEVAKIPTEPITVSPKTERALTRKQKIVTDNGIELLVPVNYLRNPDYVEYVQAEDGTITILLKDIQSIVL